MPYFAYTEISFGPITIYVWGFFLGLAFLISLWLILSLSRQEKIPEEKIGWLGFFIFLGSILGSRLGYILQFPKYYWDFPWEIFKVWSGGLTFYGGFIGAIFIGWLGVKKLKLDFFKIADIFALALPLGIFIGRIGCFLTNDHQGAVTNLPWGILWPNGIVRQPVALYLALNALLMFFVLRWLKNKLKKTGQLFIVFLIYEALSRFFLDFTRATDTWLADPRYQYFSVSQWLALIIFLISLIIYWRKFKTARP